MENDDFKRILDPKKSGLVVWDVQNMTVERISNKKEFLENTNALIKTAHDCGIPVFFSKITPLPERFESEARKFFYKNRKLNMTPEGLELAIKPDGSDTVISKNTASIFIGTNFELMVRNAGITTLVFTGIATEIGVESSARDALNRGIFPVIAEDAVSSGDKDAHERSLLNMRKMFIVLETEEISRMLKINYF